MEELFRWMRGYNENKSEEERIHLYRVDTPFTRYGLDTTPLLEYYDVLVYFDETLHSVLL